MQQLRLGVIGRSRKPDEFRLAIHPKHFEAIDPAIRQRIFLEVGYGERFGVADGGIAGMVGGMRTREQLIQECEVLVLPKPAHDDLAELREGQVLWGWPHCVQDETITQVAIDKRLTVIAWEAMNHWTEDGSFRVHVFHENNELAGYSSVLHSMQLIGTTGSYGRRLNAVVISFGATARGAVTALDALGVLDVTVLTHRDITAVASPIHAARMLHFERDTRDPSRAYVIEDSERRPLAEFLAEHDIIVNCALQDTDAPLMFVTNNELGLFESGSLIVDVSCDEGMGFEWARPTSFVDPMLRVGAGISYYAVDHSPSYLWDSATSVISEALIPHLATVMEGPGAWEKDETIRRAIDIRDGTIRNPRILSFQHRAAEYPHARL